MTIKKFKPFKRQLTKLLCNWNQFKMILGKANDFCFNDIFAHIN